MIANPPRSPRLMVRIPPEFGRHLDEVATAAGLSRSQLVRLVLGRLRTNDLPPGLIENADALRTANRAGTSSRESVGATLTTDQHAPVGAA
jgi:hypothetical protein